MDSQITHSPHNAQTPRTSPGPTIRTESRCESLIELLSEATMQLGDQSEETRGERGTAKEVFKKLEILEYIACNLSASHVSLLLQASKELAKAKTEADPTFKLTALSLIQNKARHELYNNKEFKTFLKQTFLDENKIFGNIYGSENQKKIILELLEKIKTTTDNDEEKTQFQDWLLTYLKGCDSVDLSNTKITDESLKNLVQLFPQLTSLNLVGCFNITNDGIQALVGLTQLESLNLVACYQITNLSPLSELKILKSLKLSGYNNITDESLKNLVQLFPQLKSLDLVGCFNITNDGIQALGGLTQLESLNLVACDQITFKGIQDLSKLINLKSLDLRYCDQITNDDVSQLRSSLPTLIIRS